MTCVAFILATGLTACSPVYVVDGDTLGRRGAANIRLWGFDTPEWDEPGFDAASEALERLVAGRALTCDPMGESFDRIVARCVRDDGLDLGCQMIRLGHAEEMTRFSRGAYRECE